MSVLDALSVVLTMIPHKLVESEERKNRARLRIKLYRFAGLFKHLRWLKEVVEYLLHIELVTQNIIFVSMLESMYNFAAMPSMLLAVRRILRLHTKEKIDSPIVSKEAGGESSDVLYVKGKDR